MYYVKKADVVVEFLLLLVFTGICAYLGTLYHDNLIAGWHDSIVNGMLAGSILSGMIAIFSLVIMVQDEIVLYNRGHKRRKRKPMLK